MRFFRDVEQSISPAAYLRRAGFTPRKGRESLKSGRASRNIQHGSQLYRAQLGWIPIRLDYSVMKAFVAESKARSGGKVLVRIYDAPAKQERPREPSIAVLRRRKGEVSRLSSPPTECLVDGPVAQGGFRSAQPPDHHTAAR